MNITKLFPVDMFYLEKIKNFFRLKNKAFVKVFGCLQNEADAEKICGFLAEAGFEFVSSVEDANLITVNTCAVRHTAQNRAFGFIGELKKIKESKNAFIIICGCMVEQTDVRKKIKISYPFVDMCIGAKSVDYFPKLICEKITGRAFDIPCKISKIKRKSNFKAWVPIIKGCNNFCSYCIVPFVRGPEKSRPYGEIISEIKNLLSENYKDITLLGQNVNSYYNDKVNFAELINLIGQINGDFVLRFMTSHPKDLTEDVIDALALNSHFSRHLHLPLQSGSNKILGLMNRKYTKEKYSEIAAYAREKIKDLTLTSDIIIGFPGETQEDFEETFSFVKETRFTSLFTFIYSPRAGTTASKIPDLTPRHEKVLRLQKIIKLQESISEEIFSRMIGKNYKILIEFCKNGFTAGRTGGNIIIKIKKEFPSLTGEFVKCKITAAERSVLFGEIYLYQ